MRRWTNVSAVATSMLVCTAAVCRAQQRPMVAVESSRKTVESQELASLVTVNMTGATLKDALRLLSAKSGVTIVYRGDELAKYSERITLHTSNMPLGVALDSVLRATKLTVVAMADGGVAVTERTRLSARDGIVTGRVFDAATGRPLRGATVSVDDATQGVTTGVEGTFRLSNVGNGEHRVIVRLLGYARQVKTVSVRDDATANLDVKLAASANTLDQVVVTGTVIPTELKAVPNAITVITAKQIEDRGITRIDQLFRGDVPGLFAQRIGTSDRSFLDEVTMFSRGTTSLKDFELRGNAFVYTAYSNPIKTYVDGVELADSKYLSQIDPKSIERIEIIAGPQASTIYGSNAINGVMQVFTKRGTTSVPQFTLNLQSGWVENNFTSARTPQHDYGAQLSGVGGGLSYNAGGSWKYTGPWTPAKQSANTDGFGGARLDMPTTLGRMTADVTLRRSITQSLQRGDMAQPQADNRQTGWYAILYDASPGLAIPTTRTLTGQTLGLTLSYAPTSWWSHELGAGSDASDTETRTMAPGYTYVYDTSLSLSQTHTERRSLRYTTTVRVPVTALAQATVTAGADAWQNVTSSMYVFSIQTLTGTLGGSSSTFRFPDHNAGAFLQTQLGVHDRLFVTYGLRAEWNPAYGAEVQPSYAPRYGVAYTQELETPLGPLTAKLRGSYGRSTRPPASTQKVGQTILQRYGAYWGPQYSSYFLPYYDYNSIFYDVQPNPDLGPEFQQGGEGGMELYFGTRGSLVVTRYNQTVDGLISDARVDSARTLVPCSSPCLADTKDADGYGYRRKTQYLNMGSIRNQGWELQGSMNVGPLTTQGTYSWIKSRSLGVNPRYRAQFSPSGYPSYQPGGTFGHSPEHTWAFGTTYTHATSSVGLNVTGVVRVTNGASGTNDFFVQHFSSQIRLPQNQWNANLSRYVYFNPGYSLVDLNASHRFGIRLEGVLQVQNLTDRYMNDYSGVYASMGRQTKLGFRLRT